MESVGVVRQLDPLGRVVLPVELRRKLNLKVRDLLEIEAEGDTIRLRKVETGCAFCGEPNPGTAYRGRPVCMTCLKELRDLALPEEA